MKELTLTLPDDLHDNLAAAAAVLGDTEAEYAVKLLQRALHPGLSRSSSLVDTPSRRRLSRRASAKLHISTPIVGLVEGLLFGDTSIGDVLRQSGASAFGLGTLNGLDGEVVVLDGTAYQQGADGTSVQVPPAARTPFMCTTAFSKESAHEVELPGGIDYQGLQAALQGEFASANVFHAVLVEGSYKHIKARAVRKQTEPRPLAAVAAEQAVFEFEDQEGWLVGFWSPPFFGSTVTVPGFHLHFLSYDKQRGGHVLGLQLTSGTAYIQPVYHSETDIPKSLDFLQANLVREGQEAELHRAEK